MPTPKLHRYDSKFTRSIFGISSDFKRNRALKRLSKTTPRSTINKTRPKITYIFEEKTLKEISELADRSFNPIFYNRFAVAELFIARKNTDLNLAMKFLQRLQKIFPKENNRSSGKYIDIKNDVLRLVVPMLLHNTKYTLPNIADFLENLNKIILEKDSRGLRIHKAKILINLNSIILSSNNLSEALQRISKQFSYIDASYKTGNLVIGNERLD